MSSFLLKKRSHILIWAIMLTYLAFAPVLYTRFILLNGKPVQVNGELPAEIEQNKYSIDGLDPIVYEGQDLYKLWGWAFLSADPSKTPDMYVREIVLISGSRHYYFPTTSVPRQGVQDTFNNLNMNLINSGFSTLIAKDVIWPGEYSVGIVFRYQPCDCAYYVATNRVVIRTANQLLLDHSNSTP